VSEAGYTLVETLASLVMIGLAMGGLTLGVQVLSRAQWSVSADQARAQAARDAQVTLEQVLSAQGAVRSVDPERLTGDGAGFQFACDQAAPCRVSLVDDPAGVGVTLETPGAASRRFALRQPGPAKLSYQGSLGASAVWPPTGPQRQVLRAISLVSENGRALLGVRLWAEQPADCAFDVVLQDCR